MVVRGVGIATASQGYIPANRAACWQYNMGRKRRCPFHARRQRSPRRMFDGSGVGGKGAPHTLLQLMWRTH